MLMRFTLPLVILALTGTTNLANAGDKNDIKALEGKWVPTTASPVQSLSFKGMTFTIVLNGPNNTSRVYKGTVKLDTTKSPKHIDLKITKAPMMTDKALNKTAVGIYEFNGTSLKWCSNSPGVANRPTEFKTQGTSLSVELKKGK